jgi:hypothetical protein
MNIGMQALDQNVIPLPITDNTFPADFPEVTMRLMSKLL